MRKKSFYLVLFVMMAFAVTPLTGFTGDAMHLEELNFYNSPKDIFRGSPSDWNRTDTQTYGISPSQWYLTWRDNPALVELQGDRAFIASMFYSGSYSDFSSNMYILSGQPTTNPGYRAADTGETYIGNSVGTDLGFLVALNNSATFGALFHYRYDGMLGEGSATVERWRSAFGWYDLNHIESVRRSDAHSTGLTLLYDVDFSDAFSLGFDLTYLFTTENMNYDENMIEYEYTAGALTGIDEEKIDRETIFNTHRLSPTIGVSFTSAVAFVLNLAVTADILFGGVEKNMDAVARANGLPFNPSDYVERLDGGSLFGYGFEAEADAEIFLTDALSLALLVNGSFHDTSWDIDGNVSGWFEPNAYRSMYLEPGMMEYEYEERTWHLTTGLGVNYALSNVVLHSLFTYTRWERDIAYYMEDIITPGLTFVPFSIFTQRTTEELDILALKVGATIDISSSISMDFGLGYSVGWGNYSLYEYIHSDAFTTQDGMFILLDETDTFHELSAAVSMIITPTENLSISLSAMGTFPLDGKSYPLTGSMINNNTGSSWQGDYFIDGDSSTWNYGGNLSIEYRF